MTSDCLPHEAAEGRVYPNLVFEFLAVTRSGKRSPKFTRAAIGHGDVSSEPLLALRETKGAVSYRHHTVRDLGVGNAAQAIAAPFDKKVRDKKRGALVSVNEAVITGQRFRYCGGFRLDRPIVAMIGPA